MNCVVVCWFIMLLYSDSILGFQSRKISAYKKLTFRSNIFVNNIFVWLTYPLCQNRWHIINFLVRYLKRLSIFNLHEATHLCLAGSTLFYKMQLWHDTKSITLAVFFLGGGGLIGPILDPDSVIAKELYLLLLCQMRDINSMSRRNILALNRRTLLQYTFMISRKMSCNQMVGFL